MPHYAACRVEIVTLEEGVVFTDDDAEVQIDEAGSIVLTYWDDDGAVVFSGRAVAVGHFELTCRSRPRTATLHRSPGTRSLEGAWSERGERGYWSVELPAPGD